MTVLLDWPSEVVHLLTKEAEEKGLTLDNYLLQTAIHAKEFSVEEGEVRLKRTVAGARILELQKSVKPDPEGWTSREYLRLGHR